MHLRQSIGCYQWHRRIYVFVLMVKWAVRNTFSWRCRLSILMLKHHFTNVLRVAYLVSIKEHERSSFRGLFTVIFRKLSAPRSTQQLVLLVCGMFLCLFCITVLLLILISPALSPCLSNMLSLYCLHVMWFMTANCKERFLKIRIPLKC